MAFAALTVMVVDSGPGEGGGALWVFFGWGCAARTLKPLPYQTTFS